MKFSNTLRLIVAVVIGIGGIVFAAPSDCTTCGDADGNGIYTISDIAYIMGFLYAGGPAPAECADIDGYDLITIRDAVAGGMLLPPSCVTQPKIVSQPAQYLEISYHEQIPPNVSSHTFAVELHIPQSPVTYSIKALDLPLFVTVDGQVPLSLSASTAASNWPGGGLGITTNPALGAILVRDLDGAVGYGYYTMFEITVAFAPSPSPRIIRLEYAELGPTMTGVFAPPNSACHYVMFLDASLNAWQPGLVSLCKCGDADNNGILSISDCVFIINHIFAGGPAPTRACQADADGSGILTISDAVRLIGFIFSGASAPSGC